MKLTKQQSRKGNVHGFQTTSTLTYIPAEISRLKAAKGLQRGDSVS